MYTIYVYKQFMFRLLAISNPPFHKLKSNFFWFGNQPPKVQRLKSITPLYLTPQNKKSNPFHSDFGKILNNFVHKNVS